MDDPSRNYYNFLELRKRESSFIWTSRELNPQLAYNQSIPRPTPTSHKHNVLFSPRIQDLLTKLTKKENVSKTELEHRVEAILDEIGYNKNLKVVRWLGYVLLKICTRVSTGIYVNIDSILQLKSKMGDCPVILVPSHRSYADFILMSLVCFTFDLEIPAVAAGMDFHGMWGMGSLLRDTGAFFMRRSYNDDPLYWATFKQYVYQLVTKGDLPIEFFIEGTRSRSNKSLVPKYGLISMVLKAFFFSEVPDIKFVPVNISYDRILEETLFAYELLGIPKPKESTSGFFKSLKIIHEKFGNIYFHFGEPISAKTYFGTNLDRSVHNKLPLHLQEITEREKSLIPPLAHDIVLAQQKCSIITVFNLVSLILNHNLVFRNRALTVKELIEEVRWVKGVMEKLGAFVHSGDVERSVEECFGVHQNLVEVQSNRVGLVRNTIILDKINPTILKGHLLSEQCMTFSVPFVMLQLYINPTLHYFIDVMLIVVILKKYSQLTTEELFNKYNFLRSLFSVEFITLLPLVKTQFENSLNHLSALDVIKHTSDTYELTDNEKVQDFLYTMLQPFMTSYFVVTAVLETSPNLIDEKTILVNTQRILENKIDKPDEFIHPYCLNLDTLMNCLNVFEKLGALNKTRSANKVIYEIKRDDITQIKERLGEFLDGSIVENTFDTQIFIQNKL